MIKVAHIVTSVNGGAGIATLRLHRALRLQQDVESYIIQKNDTDIPLQNENVETLYESTNLYYRLCRKLKITPEEKQKKLIAQFPQNHEYEIATFPTSSYRIEDHPLVKEADIIHLHWVANFLNYPTFFKAINKPIVWTLHDKNPFHGIFHTETDETNNAETYGTLDRKIESYKVQHLQHAQNMYIVAPSQWLLNKSQSSKALGRFSHHLIANSIDIEQCTVGHQQARETLELRDDKKTLMFIAHSIDIPRRGFYIMKEALENSIKKPINLITVGGSKIDIFNSQINHIHYESTNDSRLLNTIYAASDVQILPTQEDNLPNVMLESFANGTPVISFANGGMAEHITTGKNGILIDQIGVTPLQNAIDDFVNEKYTFNRDSIKQYAADNFDKTKQTEKYVHLYNQVLNK